MRTNLTASQVEYLQALDEAPQGLTLAQLEKTTGVKPSATTLGPVYQESLGNYPLSLYGRKMVALQRWAEDQEVIVKITSKGREIAKTFSAKKRLGSDSAIPPKLLDPAVLEVKATKTYGLELFTDADLEEVRARLPAKYHRIALPDLRQRVVNRRKQGAFVEERAVPEWYRAYRKSAHFRKMRTKALEFYNGCALDASHVDGVEVYHRTFSDRDDVTVINRERPEDLLVLCSKCWRRNRKFLCLIPTEEP